VILGVPVTASNMPEWIRRTASAINQLIAGNPALKSYTVAELPTGESAGTLIYVSDESGGAVPAFFDGTDWLRVTDRAVVS
jgi:hypothetical protein